MTATLGTNAAEDDAPPQAAEEKKEPFAFADFTWLTGSPRTTSSPLDTPAFTFEFRVDTSFHYDFAHPADNTISGSSEVFRSGEVQVTQLGVGGDLHWKNVRGRLMTQFGMYSRPLRGTTPARDEASGTWPTRSATSPRATAATTSTS